MVKMSIEYELLRSRRRTLAIEVLSDGSVLVRSPKGLDPKVIEEFVKGKESWIEKQKARMAAYRDDAVESPVITAQEIRRLKEEAKVYFPEKTAYFAGKMKVSYGRISIKCQKSLWGSCSAKGNLNFNCLLMLLGDELREYVIVHELAHRIHMDHSASFWRCVENVIPDYRARRLRLKKEGRLILKSLAGEENKTGRFYAYILRCADNTLYTGYTNDPEKRVEAHNSGRGAKYTRLRRPVRLVYLEEYDTKQKAMRREAMIKQMTKREKEKLIASYVPNVSGGNRR